MKKNFYLALALSAALSSGTMAQQVRNCGTMQHLHEQEMNDPNLMDRMQQIEVRSQEWINMQSGSGNKTTAVITIPVVVHVVYNTTAQNISDAQIQSQIAILNQDFRKLNADVSLVPSVFAGLAADCEIEFCLAQRDPNGNATTGIVRKATTVTSFSTNDNIKRSANGGDDAWNSSLYLNLWVGNLSGGVLGYAQFPGGAAATDGVVCLYSAFGNIGTAAAPFNKGRTATHEIGHWLNLRHIWGDASCGNDQVTDTPTSQTANYGCPSFPHVTCSNGPNGDMFMNYMDYTDDACMYMFSAGQKARMVAAINTYRTGILTSQGCVPPSGGSSCGTPASLNATSITTTSATLGWGTVSGASSYNVQYRSVGSATWTSTTSTTTSKAISGLSAATNYEFQVQAVCSTSTGTFSASGTFTTAAAACTDAYESNNSRAASKSIPFNTNISAKIGTGTDKDWFTFTTVAGATYLKVVLDQLPADYDLKLYGPNGGTLATSALGGTSTETIIRNTASTSTYYVQVYPFSSTGYNANVCYRLRVNSAGSSFRQGSPEEYTEGNINPDKMNSIDGISLYPNPSSDVVNLSFFMDNDSPVQLEVLDLLGKSVYAASFSGIEGFNKTEFSTTGMNNGVYFLRIIQDNMSVVQKFVVKH
ncbi:MAG: M43 family zinc metalloprotease [Bacteroidia bacterium]